LTDDVGRTREELVMAVWPTADPGLGSHSLDVLLSALRRELSGALDGAPLVVRRFGRYHLNSEAGVVADVRLFEEAVAAGDRSSRSGEWLFAQKSYGLASSIYGGDLTVGTDVRSVLLRERLRGVVIGIHGKCAERAFQDGDYETALSLTQRILASDPCREDAHRMAMRCHVRLGRRAQAFRQFSLCRDLLRAEFDADPEPQTLALVDLVRTDPVSV
jgi:DNA-binding SARP family transcriptional activator